MKLGTREQTLAVCEQKDEWSKLSFLLETQLGTLENSPSWPSVLKLTMFQTQASRKNKKTLVLEVNAYSL